ncbi:MAG: DHHA1 domain-containing protein, partial [Candidatus Margulisiibacteriota bacterium]
FDLVAFLDCAEWARTPGPAFIHELKLPILNIDHHPDNSAFGHFNWILPQLSSTGEMLYQWLAASGDAISADIATCLLAAISFDTGRFLYSNTTADTLAAAADLMSRGADHARIMEGLYEQKPIEALNWIKVGLDHLVVDWSLKYAYTVLPGCPASMGRDVIDFVRTLTGIEVFLVFRENDGKIKVNVRSKSIVDVSAFAHQFGGGGHVRASGISLSGDLGQSVATVIGALRRYLQP